MGCNGKHENGNGRGRIRRQGRVQALRLLYAFEQKGYQDDEHLALEDDSSNAEVAAFARGLFNGFVGEREAVDAVIDASLDNWRLQRLAVPDRCLLRLGCFELLYRNDTPPRVAINEYIELGKSYGSEGKSAKLINGVLDSIAREHRADEVRRRK